MQGRLSRSGTMRLLRLAARTGCWRHLSAGSLAALPRRLDIAGSRAGAARLGRVGLFGSRCPLSAAGIRAALAASRLALSGLLTRLRSASFTARPLRILLAAWGSPNGGAAGIGAGPGGRLPWKGLRDEERLMRQRLRPWTPGLRRRRQERQSGAGRQKAGEELGGHHESSVQRKARNFGNTGDADWFPQPLAAGWR
jgi:hypothetical protein